MSKSTFWNDGYKDGKLGLQASPPQPYSFSGHTTNVFAAEYLDGWMRGQADERAMMFADRESEAV